MRQAISQRADYKWWVFGTIAIGIFMSVSDEIGVLVAIPEIATHFDVDLPTAQWVAVGYFLAVSVLLLPMGRLADLIGRRQVYITGLATFVIGAALASSSTSVIMLIVARALEGAGCAMIQGNGMAIIISVFAGRERGKSLGSYLSAVGLGAIAGPALAGFLVSSLGWRSVFVANGLVGILGIAAALVILDQGRLSPDAQRAQRPKFDWLGATLSGGTLLAFLLAMTFGSRSGWGSAQVVAGMLAAVALLGTFIWWELKAPAPMIELRLFKRRLFSLGVTAAWTSYLGIYGILFMMPFYLQRVRGYSAQEYGLIVIPAFLCMSILGPVSGRLSDRFGWVKFNVAGLALSATGLFILATMLTDSSSLALVIPVLVLMACGTGVFDSPNSSSILSAVEPSEYGVAAGLIQLTRNSASVTSVAASTAIVVATMASMGFEPKLEEVTVEGGAEIGRAFVSGLHTVYLVLGIIVVIGIVVSVLKGERGKETVKAAPSSPLGEGSAE